MDIAKQQLVYDVVPRRHVEKLVLVDTLKSRKEPFVGVIVGCFGEPSIGWPRIPFKEDLSKIGGCRQVVAMREVMAIGRADGQPVLIDTRFQSFRRVQIAVGRAERPVLRRIIR
jgi:hypothetical protein